MFTRAQIAAADSTLSEVTVDMWVALIKNSQRYRTEPALFPNLEEAILEVDGTVKAQQLNVALDAIEALGPGEVALRGGDDGLQFSQTLEREALVSYGMSVVFDSLAAVPQTADSSASTPVTVYGRYGIAQREPVICSCCGFVHLGTCKRLR